MMISLGVNGRTMSGMAFSDIQWDGVSFVAKHINHITGDGVSFWWDRSGLFLPPHQDHMDLDDATMLRLWDALERLGQDALAAADCGRRSKILASQTGGS